MDLGSVESPVRPSFHLVRFRHNTVVAFVVDYGGGDGHPLCDHVHVVAEGLDAPEVTFAALPDFDCIEEDLSKHQALREHD